jgi:hypothetical protein
VKRTEDEDDAHLGLGLEVKQTAVGHLDTLDSLDEPGLRAG